MAGKDCVLKLQRITKKKSNVLATNILQYYITIFRFWKIKSDYNPDFIWCSDKNLDYLKKNLKKYFWLETLNIIKILFLQKIMSKKVIKLHALLFPKVSIECLNLINFTMQFLKSNNSINFIWRFHPIIDIKKF